MSDVEDEHNGTQPTTKHREGSTPDHQLIKGELRHIIPAAVCLAMTRASEYHDPFEHNDKNDRERKNKSRGGPTRAIHHQASFEMGTLSVTEVSWNLPMIHGLDEAVQTYSERAEFPTGWSK